MEIKNTLFLSSSKSESYVTLKIIKQIQIVFQSTVFDTYYPGGLIAYESIRSI